VAERHRTTGGIGRPSGIGRPGGVRPSDSGSPEAALEVEQDSEGCQAVERHRAAWWRRAVGQPSSVESNNGGSSEAVSGGHEEGGVAVGNFGSLSASKLNHRG
jgi:hypothetical protein